MRDKIRGILKLVWETLDCVLVGRQPGKLEKKTDTNSLSKSARTHVTFQRQVYFEEFQLPKYSNDTSSRGLWLSQHTKTRVEGTGLSWAYFDTRKQVHHTQDLKLIFDNVSAKLSHAIEEGSTEVCRFWGEVEVQTYLIVRGMYSVGGLNERLSLVTRARVLQEWGDNLKSPVESHNVKTQMTFYLVGRVNRYVALYKRVGGDCNRRLIRLFQTKLEESIPQ